MTSPNQLSFLPDDYLARKAQRRTNTICVALFVLMCAGIGSAFTLREKARKLLDAEEAQVDAERTAGAQRLEQAKQMQEKQRRMFHQAELTASLLERVPRSYLLADITNSMPAGVSLLELTLDSKPRAKAAPTSDAGKTAYELKKAAKSAAAGAAPGNAKAPPAAEPRLLDVSMKLLGVAQTDVQVAQFLNRLSRSKLLTDVNLVVTEEFKQGEDKLRKFQMDMMLNPDAEVRAVDAQRTATTNVELKE